MTELGQLTRRVRFRQRALVGNSRTGDWVDVVVRDARIVPRFGTEVFQAARMAGKQPVTITIVRDQTTETIDNSFSAKDARKATIVWDILTAVVTEDLEWVEILATQRLGGDEDE